MIKRGFPILNLEKNYRSPDLSIDMWDYQSRSRSGKPLISATIKELFNIQ